MGVIKYDNFDEGTVLNPKILQIINKYGQDCLFTLGGKNN